MISVGQVVSEEMVENVDDEWTTDGKRMIGYTISAPLGLKAQMA